MGNRPPHLYLLASSICRRSFWLKEDWQPLWLHPGVTVGLPNPLMQWIFPWGWLSNDCQVIKNRPILSESSATFSFLAQSYPSSKSQEQAKNDSTILNVWLLSSLLWYMILWVRVQNNSLDPQSQGRNEALLHKGSGVGTKQQVEFSCPHLRPRKLFN